MNKEIERKWLVSGFPNNIEPIKAYYIEQSYLITGEQEARLRRALPIANYPCSMSEYKMTLKGPGTYTRLEVEIELLEQQYLKLLQFINDKAPILKEYRKYRIDGHIVEFSCVDNNWYYAEVEFDNEDAFNDYQFPWPDLVIKDVTIDAEYKMKNYWRKTREQN